MSKAAQARPPRLSARDGGQGFSLRRTEEKGHLWMETN